MGATSLTTLRFHLQDIILANPKPRENCGNGKVVEMVDSKWTPTRMQSWTVRFPHRHSEALLDPAGCQWFYQYDIPASSESSDHDTQGHMKPMKLSRSHLQPPCAQPVSWQWKARWQNCLNMFQQTFNTFQHYSPSKRTCKLQSQGCFHDCWFL